MQDTGPITCTTHPCITQPHHVTHSCLEEFFRDRQHAPFGKTRCSQRSGTPQNQNTVFINLKIRIMYSLLHCRIIIEYDRGSAMLQQVGIGSDRFDHATVGCQVSSQETGTTGFGDRVFACSDHIIINHFRILDLLCESDSADCLTIRVEQISHTSQHGAETSGVEEVFHEKSATGSDVSQNRSCSRKFIKAIK